MDIWTTWAILLRWHSFQKTQKARMNRIITLLAITLLLTNCKKEESGFVINGNIIGIPDSTLVKLYDLDAETYIDSSFTIHGSFILKGKVDQPTTCWLQVNGESTTIQVENVEMSFQSTMESVGTKSVVTGGREQELRNELIALQTPYNQLFKEAYDSLVNGLFSSDEQKKLLVSKFNESQQFSHKVYVDFGLRNPNSYLGLDIIYRNRNSIPQDTLERIYSGLAEQYQQTSKAQAIKIAFQNKVPEVGDKFIDFDAMTLDGEEFKLSSLQGNYIYLSFWNAGCGPCRLENRFFSENLQSIPDNLDIVSFSTDKNLENWKRASEKDNITWHNVSDGEGEIGTVKTKYGVQAIPMSFLIDENGIIIKKMLGFDPDKNIVEELKNFIAENK